MESNEFWWYQMPFQRDNATVTPSHPTVTVTIREREWRAGRESGQPYRYKITIYRAHPRNDSFRFTQIPLQSNDPPLHATQQPCVTSQSPSPISFTVRTCVLVHKSWLLSLLQARFSNLIWHWLKSRYSTGKRACRTKVVWCRYLSLHKYFLSLC